MFSDEQIQWLYAADLLVHRVRNLYLLERETFKAGFSVVTLSRSNRRERAPRIEYGLFYGERPWWFMSHAQSCRTRRLTRA